MFFLCVLGTYKHLFFHWFYESLTSQVKTISLYDAPSYIKHHSNITQHPGGCVGLGGGGV